jgi:hypothetical protein
VSNKLHTTQVFAIAGATCKSSSVVQYQQLFQRDVSNLAFVHIFINSFSISGSSVRRFSNALPSQILNVVGKAKRQTPYANFTQILTVGQSFKNH